VEVADIGTLNSFGAHLTVRRVDTDRVESSETTSVEWDCDSRSVHYISPPASDLYEPSVTGDDI
jgi:hypothetical protein